MILKINKILKVGDRVLVLRFTNGAVKPVDFLPLLVGEVYQPLLDMKFFHTVKLEHGTVSWSNGADFAPEFLYKKGQTFEQKVLAKYQILAAPEICKFDGIAIFMHYSDHLPPHFHAEYGDEEVLIDIDKLEVHKGSLPKRKLTKVILWAKHRQDALKQKWDLSRKKKPLGKLEPLTKGEK